MAFVIGGGISGGGISAGGISNDQTVDPPGVVIATTCCCPAPCRFCDPYCQFRQYAINPSGFTGACSVFNGANTLTFNLAATACGTLDGNPDCTTMGNGDTVFWTADLGGGNLICLACTGEDAATPNELSFWMGSTKVASYSTGATPFQCFSTTLNQAFSRSSSTCSGSPASINVTYVNNDPWSCECKAYFPLPTTLHLTITNSTCTCGGTGSLANGVYAMTFVTAPNDSLEDPSGWLYYGGNWWVEFLLDFFGAGGADPACTSRYLIYTCGFNGYTVKSFGVAGCSCSPLSTSGHMVIADGDATDCCGSCSFDWSVAP